MPKPKKIPSVKYVQVKPVDEKAIASVYDFLFEKVLEQRKAKKQK